MTRPQYPHNSIQSQCFCMCNRCQGSKFEKPTRSHCFEEKNRCYKIRIGVPFTKGEDGKLGDMKE